jgi:hypothetical protein
MFCGAYEGGDLDRCENGGVEEERKEARGRLRLSSIFEPQMKRVWLIVAAYRSRKGANVQTNASQRRRSAAPENRADKERSSARRRSVGRARLCRGAVVGGGGVGGGIPGSFCCELIEAAAV